ncbi:MAG TPA: FAD:protein FMN transferase [Candidatus Lachnoclostridium stercoripullorum]|uniref:FAD:protein FMN transferase n=1 Tax=Candidatus Lachnoclostridium stercoripullorum TaxID=2838635 RepID=A0A9D1W478_9FIRM|nr:FAD:protein FMN transferase [Candidatus Lachnoclostridium stercoripullorum]
MAAAVLVCASVLAAGGCGRRQAEPVSRSDFLLNTFVTVTLYDSEDEAILDGCLELCSHYEDLLSRTKEDSEIFRLNHREPGTREMEVSAETAEVIERGLYYSRLSGGAFDITVEPLSSLWDFTAAEPELPDPEMIRENLPKVGYERVSVSGNTIVFADDETRIDLGAIAKGYIADKMKEYLLEQGVESAIINLGGNVLCVGGYGEEPFRIGIQRPYADRSETVGVLEIRDLSAVSSGVYERHFEKDGVNYHHILDPKTGYPYENGLTAVTIVSEKSVDGDGLSTTCFSLGLERGMELVNSLEHVWAVFITDDGELHYSDGMEQWLARQ